MAGCPEHGGHSWSSSQPIITHCQHGLDLRITPRCYLCEPAATPAPLDVLVAAQELSDALDAPGPNDPIDGEPLSRETVNEAWEVHGLRVDLARDALRAALATAYAEETP
jgi:hypothetical protein